MTTSTSLSWISQSGELDQPRGISFKLTEDSNVQLFEDGLIVDFTEPDGPRIYLTEGSLRDFRQLRYLIRNIVPADVWAILIFATAELVLLLFLVGIARYVSEAAVIRSAQLHLESGENPSFRQSLRLGWSRTAWRLFLIDFLVSLVLVSGFVVTFLLVCTPLLLWASGSITAGILGTGITFLLLFPLCFLFVVALLARSFFRQIFYRACSLDELGVFAAIRRGFAVVRNHFLDVGVTWLIWVGSGLVGMVAILPLMTLLIPLILLGIIVGVALGAIPALLELGLSGFALQGGFAPWVIAVLVGLLFFTLVSLSPLLFLVGLVRLFLSNLWTLAYRELPPMSQAEIMPVSQQGLLDMKPVTVG